MKNRIVIIIITVLLLAVGVYFAGIQIKEENPVAFRVEVTSDGHTEHIDYWQGPDGCFYVFLPGYVAFEDIKFDVRASKAFINGEELKDGMSCAAFEKNCFYDFSYRSWGKTYTGQIQFMQSANIATMYIGTDSGSMDYIHQLKGNEESGNMVLYAADGQLNYSGRIDSMNGRGNDTWGNYEKKPYSVKLDNAADLLQMGEAEKWILLANAKDASNLNNKIVYDFADRIGLAYSPDAEWVDLYLNNKYMGLYLLCERIETGESRVNISSAEADGSYIVSQEIVGRLYEKEDPYFVTEAGIGLRIHEMNMIGNQTERISSLFQTAERAILSEDGVDVQTGLHYTEIIDMDSWVRRYLVEEIFMSYDASYGSQYYYGNIDGTNDKIYAGPVWDYDHALARQRFILPDAMIANREYIHRYGYTPWYHCLYQKEEFYQQVVLLYETEFRDELKTLQEVEIDMYLEQITPAAMMNQTRWFLGTEEDFEQNVQDIDAFLTQRVAFLDKVWLENMQYYTVRVEVQDGIFYTYYTVPVGERIKDMPTLPEREGFRFMGWYDADGDMPFEQTQIIEQDMHIYAKWEPIE
ncbi:MAG: CotH kinase family protein [Lachnospiraceae bacterium]|nr:CotH kinase family protein [Lachnospiraceae bacterium]